MDVILRSILLTDSKAMTSTNQRRDQCVRDRRAGRAVGRRERKKRKLIANCCLAGTYRRVQDRTQCENFTRESRCLMKEITSIRLIQLDKRFSILFANDVQRD